MTVAACSNSVNYRNHAPSHEATTKHSSDTEYSLSRLQKQLESLSYQLRHHNCSINLRTIILKELRQYWHYLLSQSDFLQPLNASYTRVVHLMVEIAIFLSDSSLLIIIDNTLPRTVIDKASLYNAFLRTGRYHHAKQLLSEELLKNPDNHSLYDDWKCFEMFNKAECLRDKELLLIPLASYHLEDFYWQYSQSIMELCNLPQFTDNEDWLAWLSDMQNGENRSLFAIIHEEWGFIGSVNLQVINGSGFFYYWLGEDFQGCQFGPRAVHLLLSFGYREKGMQQCFAKVYEYNHISRKAIKKIGFNELAACAFAPYQDEVFYYQGHLVSEKAQYTELKNLLANMGSPIEVYPKSSVLVDEKITRGGLSKELSHSSTKRMF